MSKLAWAFALLLAASASRAQSGIPATVADADYPGTIALQVDASDIDRRIQRVRERIPARPGPLVLWYPKWIPGNHSPTGPIAIDSTGHYSVQIPLIASRRQDDLDGRVYTIVVRARDVSGNAATASTLVIVPHDHRATSSRL